MRTPGRRVVVAIAAGAAILGTGVVALHVAPERYVPWDTAHLDTADDTELTPVQRRVVELVRTEHAAQQPGEFYSDGADEDWCANFVSWVMRESGAPLANPNSGGWRIPGVYTLQEFYEATDRFEAVDSGYRPAVGDVVLYENSWFLGVGQHTNIVVAVDGDTVTTAGGNEWDRVRLHNLDWRDDSAVVGFGTLGGA
ncbi:CHAP domain-containing protein [Rhodococcus sp. HNM0569]|uniref:CHAP domain-containing protein n=1 Tax=Rhodococcus sp. HNM0569 TaxID=2716340 RepID=UPI00146E7F72|nr:CHAP domain-containing protein [Rhodococcus sp. HNM0569]NLU83393.1 CHAP domain-containing protein [Rhodococcus sp. HNM0569]